MKRLMSILICLCMLLPVIPVMATGLSDVMCVYNCKEWVSLRTMPIKDAKVLKRIPLGAKLDAVYYADGGYEPDAFAYVRYKIRGIQNEEL